MRTVARLEFDVMLESKSKDIALIRLRNDLLRYASDVASAFGLHKENAAALAQEEATTMETEKYSAA